MAISALSPKTTSIVADCTVQSFPGADGLAAPPAQRKPAGPQPVQVSVADAPPYLRRSYILTGYPAARTYGTAAYHTLCGYNNETLNAWTMIVGLVAMTWMYFAARAWFPSENTAFLVFLLSAICHTPFSIGLHCFTGVSVNTRDRWRVLDIGMIATCCVPRGAALAWYVFSQPLFYYVFVLALALDYMYCLLSIMYWRGLSHDIPKKVIAKDLAMLVSVYPLPVLLAGVQETLVLGAAGPALKLYLGMAASLLLAAYLYAEHIPECWHPGRFDRFGNSHQIMHILVIGEYALEWLFMCHMAGKHAISA
ncbi:hypothetical protein WJX72_007319 [[Myrmecia] bisecta]|uniref:Uncharacterized protein n=1 Tax=[Myrmecia] bisecta TaxID=41462 RepID=A0AAW1Q3R1_9CHLO